MEIIRSILIASGAAVIFGFIVWLVAWVRDSERDVAGNPVLRYVAGPYIASACAVAFISIGIIEWFVPANHKYTGNLLILSFVPLAVGAFAAVAAAYFFTFRATLSSSTIRVARWPFGIQSLAVQDLEAIESKGANTVLRFTGGRRFVVYYTYSGRAQFLDALRANKSFKPTREKPRAA